MTDADEAAQGHERTLNALYAFALTFTEVGRSFARHQGIHTTDATAIMAIIAAEDRGDPLTPARLAERIPLTTGATSILLNRLEEAGHIVRVRGGHHDRRLVTLHSTPEVHATADAFYAPMNRQLHEILNSYSAAEIDLVENLVSRLRSTMGDFTS